MTHSLYQLPNDIRSELSIDSSGKVWASARAVARLAGVDRGKLIRATHGLLAKIKSGGSQNGFEALSECLKPFAGFDYWVDYKIPDILVSAIIHHYAYEAKITNRQAKQVAWAMGAVGFRTWFLKELRWEQESALPQSDSGLKDILTGIAVQIQNMERKFDARVAAEEHYLGIAKIIDGLANQKLLPPADLKEPFTAKEYAKIVQGVELTTGESRSLGKFAADAFTVVNSNKPDKNNYGNTYVYYHRDLQAWAVVFDTWLEFAGFNSR